MSGSFMAAANAQGVAPPAQLSPATAQLTSPATSMTAPTRSYQEIAAAAIAGGGKPPLPKPGDMFNGHQFLGGDPRAQTAWKPLSGQDYLNSMPLDPEKKTLIQAIANYDLPPGSGRGGIGSPEVQQLLGYVKTYDPTFDAKNYKARQDMINDINDKQNGLGGQISNLTNAALHARDMAHAYDRLGNSDALPPETQEWLKAAHGRLLSMLPEILGGAPNGKNPILSALGAASTASNFLAPEAARIGMGATPNEAEINNNQTNLAIGAGPSAQAGTLGDIASKIGQRLLTIQDRYKRAFGNTPPKVPLINPDAARAVNELLTRYGRPEADQIDFNTLTAGGFNPKAAQGVMETPPTNLPPKAAPTPQSMPRKGVPQKVGRFLVEPVQ